MLTNAGDRAMTKRIHIEEIKVGEFAGYYGVFVGGRCNVYTPSWADAVAQKQALERQHAEPRDWWNPINA